MDESTAAAAESVVVVNADHGINNNMSNNDVSSYAASPLPQMMMMRTASAGATSGVMGREKRQHRFHQAGYDERVDEEFASLPSNRVRPLSPKALSEMVKDVLSRQEQQQHAHFRPSPDAAAVARVASSAAAVATAASHDDDEDSVVTKDTADSDDPLVLLAAVTASLSSTSSGAANRTTSNPPSAAAKATTTSTGTPQGFVVRQVSVDDTISEPSLSPGDVESDFMVDTSSPKPTRPPQQGGGRNGGYSPKRGLLHVPGFNKLSSVRLEEPKELATASSSHDLTETTERSEEEDFSMSPVATNRSKQGLVSSSRAASRGASSASAQQQQHDPRVAAFHGGADLPVSSRPKQPQRATSLPGESFSKTKLQSKASAVVSPSLLRDLSAVKVQEPNLNMSSSSMDDQGGAGDRSTTVPITSLMVETSNSTTTTATSPSSSPSMKVKSKSSSAVESKKKKKHSSSSRRTSAPKSASEKFQKKLLTALSRAAPLLQQQHGAAADSSQSKSQRRQRSGESVIAQHLQRNTSKSYLPVDDDGEEDDINDVVDDDIDDEILAIKNIVQRCRQASAATGVVAVSPEMVAVSGPSTPSHRELKEELERYDNTVLLQTIARASEKHRRHRTTSLPGAVAVSGPPPNVSKEEMLRQYSDLLQDAMLAMKKNNEKHHQSFRSTSVPGAFAVSGPPSPGKDEKLRQQQHNSEHTDCLMLLEAMMSDRSRDKHQRRRTTQVPGAFPVPGVPPRHASKEKARDSGYYHDGRSGSMPGAVPISGPPPSTKKEEEVMILYDDKSREKHYRNRSTTTPGAVAIPGPPPPSKLKEEEMLLMTLRRVGSADGSAVTVKAGEKHRNHGAVPVRGPPPTTSKGQDERNDIQADGSKHRRTSSLPGAVPVSGPPPKLLKDEEEQHDNALLQAAIAMQTDNGKHRHRHSRKKKEVPGAAPFSGTSRTRSEADMELNDSAALAMQADGVKLRRKHQSLSSPGAFAVSGQPLSMSKEEMEIDDSGLLQAAIAMQADGGKHSYRKHQPALVPGAFPVPGPPSTSKEELELQDMELLQAAIAMQSHGGIHKHQTITPKSGAFPVDGPPSSTLKEELERNDSKLLNDAIAMKTSEYHRSRTRSHELKKPKGDNLDDIGDVPISPRGHQTLKDDMDRHDLSLLQLAVAIKASRRPVSEFTDVDVPGSIVVPPREYEIGQAQDRTQNEEVNGTRQDDIEKMISHYRSISGHEKSQESSNVEGPGAVYVPPETDGGRQTLKEAMLRRDEGLLRDAAAIKSGSQYRRNRRLNSAESSDYVRPGAIHVSAEDDDNRHNLKEAMKRHDEGLLQDAVAIKTGSQYRRTRTPNSVRRIPGDREVSSGLDSSDHSNPDHSSESLQLRRRRLHRQTAKALAAGEAAALNAKMEEYDNLVRRKEEQPERDVENARNVPDEVERPEYPMMFEDEPDEELLDIPNVVCIAPDIEAVPDSVDDTTAIDSELRDEDAAPTSRDHTPSAYVQPYSEWEAEAAAKSRTKEKRRLLVVLAVIVTVIAAVIGVVVAVTSSTGHRTAPPSSTTATDTTPCVEGSDFNSTRFAALHSLIMNHSLGQPIQIEIPRSAQRRAICWLAVGDNLQLSPDRSSVSAIIQRYTLAVLYYGLTRFADDTDGLAATNFLTSVSECSWDGIACTIPNTVTTISIFAKKLAGRLPGEILNLRNADIVVMNNNQIVALPTELWKMTWLETLDFGGNQLASKIPSEITQLTNLKSLLLDTNHISGTLPSDLFSLSNLGTIALQSNSITGKIPTPVNNHSSLVTLLLASNKLKGPIPSEIGLLTNLDTLDLSLNLLTGTIPPTLGNLTNARYILLNTNLLTGSVPAEVCRLVRNGSLETLGVDPTMECSCCT